MRSRARRASGALVAGLLSAGEPVAAAIRFTDVTAESGVRFAMTSGAMPSREILDVNGGGVALFDYDRDGDLDLFFADGATAAAPENGPGSRLFANRGDGRFDDVTAKSGIALRRWAMGVAVGDVDGDGWDDLYVTCYGPNVLFRNAPAPGGGRRFEDATARAGVGDPGWSTSAAFGDLDADGDLDLYVANYLEFDPRRPPARTKYRGVAVMTGPRGLPAQADRLYENRGDGTFRDATAAAGIVRVGDDYGLVVRLLDFDADGRPDIFVGNDSTANQLYRNLGGLRFEEVAAVAGFAASGTGVSQATMGIAFADVDGDGAADLFNTAFSDDTNTLRLNLGRGLFDDRSAQYGVAASSRPFLSWGCGFYDFDLDGDEDLLVSNGHVYPEMASPAMGAAWAQELLLYERRGRRFERVEDGPGGLLRRALHGRAVAFGDLDGDQDVDVVLTTLNGPPLLLRNDATPGAALAIELEAPAPNRHAYGAVVELETPAGVSRRWITGGGSFQSVDAPAAYFGLAGAPAPAAAVVRVRWPDGSASRHEVTRGAKAVRIAKPGPVAAR